MILRSWIACHAPAVDPAPAAFEGPPNVLVVTLDTLRADVLGAYGGRRDASPVFDGLVAEGAVATRAYTVTPLTIPAHSSLMTGVWPPRHGVQDNGDYFLGADAVTLAERLHERGYATMASVGAEVTSRHWGFGQGFDVYHDEMGDARLNLENRWAVERRADAVVGDTVRWLEAQSGAQPWFVWTHLFDCHDPYAAPDAFAAQFPDEPYMAEVAWTDHNLGVLLDTVERRGWRDRTWVIVLADHGEALGSHGEARHGVLLYDATTRIPLVIRPPGGGAPARIDFPVSLVDVVPTVLAAVGAGAVDGLDGIDLGPWVTGRSTEPPGDRTVYVESLYAWHHYGWAPQRALVDGTHKLIGSTTPELYDRSDRREATNLMPIEPARGALLLDRLAATRAGMVGPGEGARTAAAMSPALVAQLEALGYVTETPDAPADEVGLPDPVARLPALAGVEAGRRQIAARDFVGALASLDATIGAEPGLLEPRLLRAFALLGLDRPDDARVAAQEAVAMRRTSSSLTALANVALVAGDPAAAIPLLEEAIAIDPFQAVPWTRYLAALEGSGDLDRLAAAVARCRATLPDLLAAEVFAAKLALAAGDPVGAQRVLEGVVARNPDEPVAWFLLGLLRRQAGDDDSAEAALLEEVRIEPTAVMARKELVTIYAEQKRYAEQAQQLEVVLGIERFDAQSWHALGQARFNLKDFEAAHRSVKSCLLVRPNDAGCTMLEANVLKKLGREDEAMQAYRHALRLAGQDPG